MAGWLAGWTDGRTDGCWLNDQNPSGNVPHSQPGKDENYFWRILFRSFLPKCQFHFRLRPVGQSLFSAQRPGMAMWVRGDCGQKARWADGRLGVMILFNSWRQVFFAISKNCRGGLYSTGKWDLHGVWAQLEGRLDMGMHWRPRMGRKGCTTSGDWEVAERGQDLKLAHLWSADDALLTCVG